MKKIVTFAVAAAILAGGALSPKNAEAAYICHPLVVAGGGGGAGAAAGFIRFVGVLAGYDLIRRTTCSGDFLGLGGPGFTTAIKPTDNVMIPQCVTTIVKKKKRRH